MTRTIRTVGIVGVGRMGSTIALACASAGIPVIVCSRREPHDVREQLGRRLSTRPSAVAGSEGDMMRRIAVTQRFEELAHLDLVIECVNEDIATKNVVIGMLDTACSSDVIIASNTSSLRLSDLRRPLSRGRSLVGLHFFNPADVMPLVEVTLLPATPPEVAGIVLGFVRTVGKQPIVVSDVPGFIVNRLLFAMICEAIRLYAAGVATADDIDNAMKLGANMPVGPLALADSIGLDTCQSILGNLSVALGPQYSPPTLLDELVASGALGRKTGQGFHRYAAPKPANAAHEGS